MAKNSFVVEVTFKVSENLGEDLTSIMAGADQRDIPSFIKFFGNSRSI